MNVRFHHKGGAKLPMHARSTPRYSGQVASSGQKTLTPAVRVSRPPPLTPRALIEDDVLESDLVGDASTSSREDTLMAEDSELMSSFTLSQQLRDRNTALTDQLRGKLILAPLTRANHLPFRRWCMEMGAEVTMSEMAFARQLLKGDKVERARLVRDQNEGLYGVQIATKMISEGVEASQLAAVNGARWLDLNCG